MTSEERVALPRIGWIGAGKMGFPMCAKLLDGGFSVCVMDANPEPLAQLERLGARVIDSVGALVDGSDIVVTMLPGDEAVFDVFAGTAHKTGLVSAMRTDQLFIDMSTISPRCSQSIAQLAATKGLAWLRAPVSGSTVSAANGQLGIFCSGAQDAFERAGPLFAHLGRATQYVGDGEEARVMKLLINMVVGAMPVILGEALAFGERSGLSRASILDAIETSAIMSPLIGSKLAMMRASDWTAMATVDTVAKDMDLALEWGRRCNTPMPFTSLAQQTYVAFQGAGQCHQDFFSTLTWPHRWLNSNGE